MNGLTTALIDHPNGYSDPESNVEWQDWNDRFIATVRTCLNANGRGMIVDLRTWVKVYARLEKRFKPQDSTTFMVTTDQLINIRDRFDNLTALEVEMEKCFAKLVHVGEPLSESYKCLLLLKALPEEYDTWRETYLALNTCLKSETPGKTLVRWDEMIASARQKEAELTNYKKNESLALLAKNKRPRPTSFQGAQKRSRPSSDRSCTTCKAKGEPAHRVNSHSTDECFHTHPELKKDWEEKMRARRRAGGNSSKSHEKSESKHTTDSFTKD